MQSGCCFNNSAFDRRAHRGRQTVESLVDLISFFDEVSVEDSAHLLGFVERGGDTLAALINEAGELLAPLSSK
ncbi:hypothetical protein HGG72_05595 [Ochrobactrum pecoris]|nr:hypothetical protein [Brucella pecoris]